MAFYAYYRAWDTIVGEPKLGDEANHTVEVQVSLDGGMLVGNTELTPVEVGDGVYVVSLTDGQCPEGARFAVHGRSTTAGVEIVGETGVRPVPVLATPANKLATDGSGRAAANVMQWGSIDLAPVVTHPTYGPMPNVRADRGP